MRPFTRRTITGTDELRRQVDAVRQAGYCYSSEEYEPGVCAIAVPVRDNAGRVLASMSIFADPARSTERDLLERVLPALRACELEARALLS